MSANTFRSNRLYNITNTVRGLILETQPDMLMCQRFSAFSCRVYFILYWAFLGTAYTALHLATNLNATSDQIVTYKDDGSPQLALVMGAVATFLWFLCFFLDVWDVFRYVICDCPWFY